MTNYTKQYFIEKFSAIPEEKWGQGFFNVRGQCCAIGHCGGYYDDAQTGYTNEAKALIRIITGCKEGEESDNDFKVFNINDANGQSAKENILTALKAAK